MTMEERILALAAGIVGGEPSALLRSLCAAAEAAWRGRLRPGVEVEACGEAFCCGAAFTAAADCLLAQSGGEIAAFTAGAVSVRTREGGSEALAAALRLTAERLMAPYAQTEDFHFQGVMG